MLITLLLILGIGRTGNYVEPKEYPLKLFKNTVKVILTSDYSIRLSEAEIKKFLGAVNADFKTGKRIEFSDFSIGLREIRPPFIFLEMHDKSVFRQTGGAALTEPSFGVAYMQSTESTIPIMIDDPRNGPCGGFNHYSVRSLISDEIPSLILLRGDAMTGSLGCIRIITADAKKYLATELSATVHPISAPAKVNASKCPGEQQKSIHLRVHDGWRCDDFKVEQIREYWDCPKQKVETFQFSCKTNKFESLKTEWK